MHSHLTQVIDSVRSTDTEAIAPSPVPSVSTNTTVYLSDPRQVHLPTSSTTAVMFGASAADALGNGIWLSFANAEVRDKLVRVLQGLRFE